MSATQHNSAKNGWIQTQHGLQPAQVQFSTLPPGRYLVQNIHGQIFFRPSPSNTDELIRPPADSISEDILKEVDAFWKSKNKFKKYGYTHRRGMLFLGPPGSGKSSLINMLCESLISSGGIVLHAAYPSFITGAIKLISEIEPDRRIIVVLEDLDSIINYVGEDDLLQYLDGADQCSNVMNIATTNHPEDIPTRFINRPRRFDKVVLIGFPDLAMRERYYRAKFANLSDEVSEEEIQAYIVQSEGLSFGGMSELVILTKCLDVPMDKAVKRVKALQKNKYSAEYYKNLLGTDAPEELQQSGVLATVDAETAAKQAEEARKEESEEDNSGE